MDELGGGSEELEIVTKPPMFQNNKQPSKTDSGSR